jgi:hypothetical protein
MHVSADEDITNGALFLIMPHVMYTSRSAAASLSSSAGPLGI